MNRQDEYKGNHWHTLCTWVDARTGEAKQTKPPFNIIIIDKSISYDNKTRYITTTYRRAKEQPDNQRQLSLFEQHNHRQ